MLKELTRDIRHYYGLGSPNHDYQPSHYRFKGPENPFYPHPQVRYHISENGNIVITKIEAFEKDPYCLDADRYWRNIAALPPKKMKRAAVCASHVMMCIPTPDEPSFRLQVKIGEVFIKSSIQELEVSLPTGLTVMRVGIYDAPLITSGIYDRDVDGRLLDIPFVLIAREAHISLASVNTIRAVLGK